MKGHTREIDVALRKSLTNANYYRGKGKVLLLSFNYGVYTVLLKCGMVEEPMHFRIVLVLFGGW